jgi:hypothetical protein
MEEYTMKQQQITSGLLIIMAVAAVSGAHYQPSPTVEDPILASFERELSHEPGQAAPTTGSGIDDDVLYDLISAPLQSGFDIREPRND